MKYKEVYHLYFQIHVCHIMGCVLIVFKWTVRTVCGNVLIINYLMLHKKIIPKLSVLKKKNNTDIYHLTVSVGQGSRSSLAECSDSRSLLNLSFWNFPNEYVFRKDERYLFILHSSWWPDLWYHLKAQPGKTIFKLIYLFITRPQFLIGCWDWSPQVLPVHEPGASFSSSP